MNLRIRNSLVLVLAVLACTLWSRAQTTTPFTFISWGDSRGTTTGSVNSIDLSALSRMATSLTPKFTIFAGDLCDDFTTDCASTTSTTGWAYAINGGTSTSNGLYNITFPFRGNHDDDAALWDSTFGADGGREAVASTFGGSNFSFYDGDSAERTYSFDYSNAHIVGIDMPSGDISTMTSGQISWLDADISAAESRGITHTFILDHGPVYYVDGHRSRPSASFIDVMNRHPSISATFHGHEHLMAHVHIDSAHISGVTHPWEEFVTGAGGAPLYTCNTRRLMTGDYCEDTENGFMSIEVNGPSFTVTLYQETGPVVEFGTFTPDKTPPTVTSFSIAPTTSARTFDITSFTATDDDQVTGYMVTTTSTPPLAGSSGWSADPPTTISLKGRISGSVTFYGWAKDTAGNVSQPAVASTAP